MNEEEKNNGLETSERIGAILERLGLSPTDTDPPDPKFFATAIIANEDAVAEFIIWSMERKGNGLGRALAEDERNLIADACVSMANGLRRYPAKKV